MGTLFWISYAVLWGLVLLAMVGVFGLYYHFAQLYLSSRDGRMEGQGPKLSERLSPSVQIQVHAGRRHPLADGGAKAVLFFSEGCPLCDRLREELSHDSRGVDFPAVLFVDGSDEHVRRWRSVVPNGWIVLPDRKGKIALRFRINSTPYCFILSEAGVVSVKGMSIGWRELRRHFIEAKVIKRKIWRLSDERDHATAGEMDESSEVPNGGGGDSRRISGSCRRGCTNSVRGQLQWTARNR